MFSAGKPLIMKKDACVPERFQSHGYRREIRWPGPAPDLGTGSGAGDRCSEDQIQLSGLSYVGAAKSYRRFVYCKHFV